MGDLGLQQGLDVVPGILRRHLVGAVVACWSATAGLSIGEDDLDAGLVEDLHQGLAHLGIGEVDEAACIEGDLLAALGLLDLLHLVPERHGGHGRQAAEVRHVRQEEGQVADEAPLLEGLLGDGSHAQHGVEQATVVHHAEDGLHGQGLALFHHQPSPQLQDEARNVDLAGAHGNAASALDAEALDVLGLLEFVEPGREDGADASRVGLAKHMAAHQPEDRAHVQAGGAADALERLLEHGVLGHVRAVVVHEDDVEFLGRAVRVGHLAREDGHVAGEQLSRGAAGQGGEDGLDVLDQGHELFDAHDGHVDAGKGRHQAGVALVGDDDEAAGFRHGDVGARDPHVRLQELGAELGAGELHQLGDVRGLTRLHLLAEDLGDLLLGHVDGWHHHVRRRLVGELDDPLAQVRLVHLDAGLLEGLVQVDLLGGHGLRLHDALHALGLGKVEDVLLHRRGVGGPEHLGTTGLRVLLELLCQLLEAGGGTALDPGDLVAHGLEVDAFVGLCPADAVGLGKAAQGACEVAVVEGGFDGFLELGGHAIAPSNSSTTTMMSRSGPCTPMVSTRSMSAVRLGPVMKEM